jgi:hypothetical protein
VQALGKEESLRDLIESRSAREGMAQRHLWRLTLDAIVVQDVLLPILPEDRSLDTPFSPGGMPVTWRKLLAGVLKDIDHYLPTKDFWSKAVKLDPDAYSGNVETPKATSPWSDARAGGNGAKRNPRWPEEAWPTPKQNGPRQ